MNRSSLLAPPVGWMCHACGWSGETAVEPLRCPKCGNSAFERTGAAEAVREAERESDRLGPAAACGLASVHRKETAMATKYECVDGCGARVSKPGGRCRTCAGLLRRKKRVGRSPSEKSPGRPPKNPGELPAAQVSVLTVGEALKAAGFSVAEVRVTEATVLVRLTTQAGALVKRNHPRKTDL